MTLDVTDEATLVMTGVFKSYEGVQALSDVSFEVRPGEIHALLGENGAGKSTLMGIASGETQPDAGVIHFEGVQQPALSPGSARDLGIAIVHQHPALLPDLSVADNIRLGVPRERLQVEESEEASMKAILADVGLQIHLNDRIGDLTLANKHLLEVAKAFAVSPRLLILDEPTAPLGKDSVELLFDHVRAIAERGTAVVYITHRMAEVRLLANRVTVLRDGKLSGAADVDDVTDDELFAWIVGRRLIDSTFPDKRPAGEDDTDYLEVSALSGEGFTDISFKGRKGDIIGVAGVVGNGQSELLAAIAGLAPFEGEISIDGTEYSSRFLRTGSAYMPADRQKEGLMVTLSVRENAAASALKRFTRGPFVQHRAEVAAVRSEFDELDVKTPSTETNVAALSGGNQQKVVMARALLSQPSFLIADEPTQGVDVGARAEIYRILREVANNGIPVIVASSDAHELEGLCDRVIVMSRGQKIVELADEEVTEERIVRAAVSATTHTSDRSKPTRDSSAIQRFLQGDYAPVWVLAAVILTLGGYILSTNDRYLSAFNITSVLSLVAALGFISIGQTAVLMLGGIDLSVGPLAGFLVVVGSFFLIDGKTPGVMILGFLAMAAAAAVVGLVNGSLVRFAKFTPVAATLTLFIGLQGLSFVLRDRPGGFISGDITRAIQVKLGPVPWSFIILVVISVLMELALRKTSWGRQLRAVGSNEDSARRLGIGIDRTSVGVYVTAALFVFLGAIVLLAQLGIGDPSQGLGYTLSSITAVVLGGTSLLGGRGTFVGTLFGAFLIVQVQNATVFLGLSQTYQFLFQGLLIMSAAIIYSQVRGLRREI
ncbi:MAG: ATP-binding cassette domain-containing protein [Acidimicrobiia bacterium]|nr:ATP-binding cassette domain-containing protein [Acidimicrobiia bacterium]